MCVCTYAGFPGGASGKEPSCKCRRHKKCGFSPWVGKMPWRRACNPLHAANSFSCVHLYATLWAIAHQAPMFMGILQERILEWVAMPSSEALPNPGIKPVSLTSPALAGGFFTTSTTWETPCAYVCTQTHGEREKGDRRRERSLRQKSK